MQRLLSAARWGGLAAVLLATPAARAAEPRLVFAHYMVCFGSSVEFYQREIELAQRHGIDGFALNCGNWLSPDGKPGPYVQSTERLYEAARRLNSGFRLFLSADVTGIRNLNVDLLDMVRRFAQHPNQYRRGGKVVLSTWAGTPESYAECVRVIKAAGFDLLFVPCVSAPKHAMAWSEEAVRRFFDGQPHMDGVFHFACDDTIRGTIARNALAARVCQGLGKVFMAGACPAYNSANLRDFRGLEGYGAVWRGLVDDRPPLVEITTWNDYNEDSNLMPFRWPAGAERDHITHDETFLHATGYYSAWYKTGRPPAIGQDRLCYVYRNRPHAEHRVWDERKGAWADLFYGEWPRDQAHDDVADLLYVTTFLTAPAELVVSLGDRDHVFAQGAGIGHAAVPLAPGVPRLTLRRGRQTLLTTCGRKEIIATPTPENSRRGYHLANRTYTGGDAVGPALRLEAEAGTLGPGAQVVALGRGQGVRNAETDGSGCLLPVTGLTTSTYVVRVRYSNPTKREARLTLTADGLPLAAGEAPTYTALFLPPTARGEVANAALLWSLYDGTTKLGVHWTAGRRSGRLEPASDDVGSVTLDALELVRLEPIQPVPARAERWPELVAIPGGTFTMGDPRGEPDERPAHPVTLAPFAIGRCEVTNEEFERFDPAHRRLRDQFSWRDRDPVIYVSWREAVGYCNWLSRETGLTPVYDPQTWEPVAGADGFRLPTEAEWEYVASGRGEGRRYPWGSAPPDATRGQCGGRDDLELVGDLSRLPRGGTRPVGSHPAGASRDGVLDLAGNVAEWCADWYGPYDAAPAIDPLRATPSPHRVIRGGSWGYYGLSQRCADREFNNPGYGGYIYVGFRVALGAAGWTRLTAAPVLETQPR
jgi:formylglycine-generating enzyme required for sulfatase activity